MVLTYDFAHAKVKKSNFSPKSLEFIGDIRIFFMTLKAGFTQILRLE